MEKSCSNCRYSQFQGKNEYGESVTLPKGFCRRFPPQYAISLRATWTDCLFPQINASDWCGEWVVALPKKATWNGVIEEKETAHRGL